MSIPTSESLQCDSLVAVPLAPCMITSRQVWEWIGKGSVAHYGYITVPHEIHEGLEGTLLFYNKVFSAKKYMVFSGNDLYVKVPSTIVDSYGPGAHPFYFRIHLLGSSVTKQQQQPQQAPLQLPKLPKKKVEETTTMVLQGRFGNTQQFSPEMLLELESHTGAFQRLPIGASSVGWTAKPRHL